MLSNDDRYGARYYNDVMNGRVVIMMTHPLVANFVNYSLNTRDMTREPKLFFFNDAGHNGV